MSDVQRQNDDGTWSKAEPLGYLGWKAHMEQFFYRWHFPRLARFMGRWDERDLGK